MKNADLRAFTKENAGDGVSAAAGVKAFHLIFRHAFKLL